MSSSKIAVGLCIIWCIVIGGLYLINRQESKNLTEVYFPLEVVLQKTMSSYQKNNIASYEQSPFVELEALSNGDQVKKALSKNVNSLLKTRLNRLLEQADAATFPLSNAQHKILREETEAVLNELQQTSLTHHNKGGISYLFWLTLILGAVGISWMCWINNKKSSSKISRLENMIKEDSGKLEVHTAFANQIGGGDLNVDVENLAEDDTLGLALIQMRDNLKKMSVEDEKRNWITKGLARFSELLREKNQSLAELGDAVISNLVTYLGATQGAIFLLESENESEEKSMIGKQETRKLKLVSCYAYDRRKYLNQTVEPGEGLVGQALLEKAPIYITDVPSGYTNIRSGLGDATPTCVFIVPLILNEKVYGVIELAAFKPLESHQQEFVEQLGESIASTVSTAQTNQLTLELLHNSQKMTAELRSQEEEMRQNLEELTTTQEQMERKEAELNARNQAVDNTLATAEFDMNLTVLSANKIFRDLLGYQMGELQGLDHRTLMVKEQQDADSYLKFRSDLRAGNVQFGEYEHSCRNGAKRVFRSAYSVIRDSNQNPVKILMVSNDITQTRELLTKLKQQKEEIENIRISEKKRADEEIADLQSKAMALVDEVRKQKDEVEQIRLDEKQRSDEEINSLNEVMNDYMMRNQQENSKLKKQIKELEAQLGPVDPAPVPINGSHKPRLKTNGTSSLQQKKTG